MHFTSEFAKIVLSKCVSSSVCLCVREQKSTSCNTVAKTFAWESNLHARVTVSAHLTCLRSLRRLVRRMACNTLMYKTPSAFWKTLKASEVFSEKPRRL